MNMTVTLGWWIIPAIISIITLWWSSKQNYSGDYNFTGVIVFLGAGFVIMTAWAIYFAMGWALS